jgi:hypothetical protein
MYIMLAAPWLAMGYSITGGITGGQGNSPRFAIAIPSSLDTAYAGIVLFGIFQITNLPEGRYIVAGFQDLNTNLFPDSGEPYGIYGGNYPDFVNLPPNATGININLDNPQAAAYFRGTMTYAGTTTGPCIVMATRDAGFNMEPRGAGFLVGDTANGELIGTDGNGNYAGAADSAGQMYAIAFMDLDADLYPDFSEPRGAYGGAIPEPFTLVAGDTLENINFVLLDPQYRVVDLTVTRSGPDVWLNWSPAPGEPLEYQVWWSQWPEIEPEEGVLLGTTDSTYFVQFGGVSLSNYSTYSVTAIYGP